MRTMLSCVTVPAVILVVACQPSANPGGLSPKDEAAVRGIDPAFAAGANAGQIEGIAATYASDAVLLPPNLPPVKGHDAIRGFWGASSRIMMSGSRSPTTRSRGAAISPTSKVITP